MKTYPLLQSQLGVLLQSMQHPESTQYNLPLYFLMPRQMNRRGLAFFVRRLFDSIPELHTRFVVDEQGEIRQWSDMSMPIPVVSRQCTEDELQAYIHDGFIRPFDLFGNEPLFRTEIVETEKNICLLADGHHAIIDGMSFTTVLTTAFAKIVAGGCFEPQPYGMYQAAEDEVASFGTEAYQRAKDYYARKFDGLEMATLSHSQPGSIGRMARVIATIDRQECIDWCSKHGVKPSHLFQAAFGYVMSVLTQEEQVVFTIENHGRTDKRLHGCVGMFAKTIPMLANAYPSCRVIDFIKSQHEEIKDAISHIEYPFTHFCSDLGMKPGAMFNFVAVKGMEELVQFGGASFRAVQLLRNEVDSDLNINIYMNGDDYEIRVESSLAMNDEATLRMVANSMRVAVSNMMAHPELTLGELDIISTNEREALITQGSGKHLDIDPQMTFVKAFERCANMHPDCLAVADATDRLTYGELLHRSNVLAARLIASGVKPNDFVAVKLDRTIAFPLAVIAIHKVGAAYVPIDLEYPEERQQYMLSDCQAKVIVDNQFILETDFSQNAVTIDMSTADGLAYMIYTSGSTGKPKGAMLHQAGLWNFINVVIDMEHLTANDRISSHRSFSFDAHIEDIYPILTLGGSIHIMPESIRLDLAAIRNFLFDHQITGGGYATPIATLLLNTYDDLPVRFMTAGGEKLAGVYSDHVEVINVYGPTECTDDISYYTIPPGCHVDNIPIGKTVANCYSFITDTQGRLLPRGAAGELCFAGIQVGCGYWQQPQLTAEKFVPCPFLPLESDGQPVCMYYTGDLCRWNEEGQLEFLGRIDNQIKLHGYRIELGEIEACARRFNGVSQVVAVIRPIKGTDMLCLYYTVDGNKTVDVEELRQFLSLTLAEYMVPNTYMQLDAMPLTPNGKLDRRNLPKPISTDYKEYVAPQDKTEEIMARLLGDVLSWQKPVSMLDNFFSLGGDSIKLIHLVSLLAAEGYTAHVSELMKCSTVREMARTLVSSSDGPAIAQDSVTGIITPGAIQRRFLSWHLQQSGRYTQSVVLRARQRVNVAHLEQVLQALAIHHDMLRAIVGDSIVIRPTTDDNLFALQEMTLPDQTDVDSAITEAAMRQGELIDLEHGPLLHAVLLHADDGDRLLMVCHHIVIDGVSWRILCEDLTTAMHQVAQGQAITLPRKTHSFAYWTEAVSRYCDSQLLMAEKPYWQELQAQMESMELTPHPTLLTTHHSLVASLEGEPLRQLLTTSAKAYNTEINDLLITALSRAYHRLTGNNSLTIQMEGHGREPLHEPVVTDRTIGWFTSIYPVVIQDLTGDLRHDIRYIKELLRAIPNKGIGYGILQYMGDNRLRTDLTPLIGFNYLGEMGKTDDNEALFTTDNNFFLHQSPTAGELGVPIPSVDINCGIAGGQFVACLEYDPAYWADEKAQRLAGTFVEELALVAAHTTNAPHTEPTASDFGATGWSEQQLQSVITHLGKRGETLQRVYPLTPMQESILTTYLANSDTTAYRLLFRLAIDMLPTEAMLRHTLDYLATKHEVLRTSILYEGVPQPCQAIISRQLGLDMRDLTAEPDVEAAATALHQEMLHRKLSLTDDPMFYLVCMKTGADSCQLLIVIHHIVIDGWCIPVIFKDFLTKFEAEADNKLMTATTEQAGHYEAYIRQLLHRDRKTGLTYWKDLLVDYDTRAAIPSYEKPSTTKPDPRLRYTFDKELTASLRQLASTTGVTLNTVMELGWGLTLQAFCRTEDVVFARVVSGRDSVGADNSQLVGLFINSIPVRVHTTSSETVRQSLKALQEQSAQSSAYDFCPLSEIMAQTQLGASLYQSIVAFENYPIDDAFWASFHNGIIKPVQIEEEPFCELSLSISPAPEGTLQLTFTYDTSLYSASQMQLVIDTLYTIARNMAAMPDSELKALPLITEAAQTDLIELGRGKHIDIDPSMTFVKAFEQCAAKCPDHLAVVDDKCSLTYRELSRCSDVLAYRLVAAGVCPNDFVAVKLDRTIAFPLAVIAIHKVGAAYVPIDLEYPEERQQYMLSDCQAKVVVDNQFILETDFSQDAVTIDLSTADGLAYMIYTSGSTGKPKGVMIGQRGLSSYIVSMTHVLGLTASDRISLHRPFSFDAHIQDLYPVLTVGGSLHIMASEIRRDIQGIRDFINSHGITGGSYTTSLGKLLIESGPLPLRYMTLTGERMTNVVSGDVELFNGYGPTECTDLISIYRLERGRSYTSIPIGRPMANSHCFIVDAQGRLLPHGAVGELCFASPQVGRGYWNQPELTAKKYVDCPFLPVNDTGHLVRMYRTGDLCRWNDENQLEYIGRIDNQVKLHGYLIELGEIEACAFKFEGIRQVVAVIRPIGNSDTLCLYYTADSNIDTSALRNHMARSLAEFMVPAAFMQLDALPLMPNGKVDQRRLPEPKHQQETSVAPATEQERQLFAIVAKQLGTVDFGVTTDLVALGLSSLDAMRLSLAICQQTGLKINVGELLANPTIRQMAEIARCQQPDTDIDLADFHYEQDSYPLTANQRGLYIDWELNPNTTQYNVPVAICFGQADANKLADALRLVVDAHSYIKTRLENRDGSVVQLCRDDAPVQVSVIAVDSEPDRDFFQQRVRPFNLFTDDLYRLEIYTYGAQTWLFKDFHHIVSDGLSDAIFFRDLQATLHGTQPKRETVTAFDYALYEQKLSNTSRHAEARDYFDALLASAEAASYPRTASGTAHKVELISSTVADSDAIRKACRRMGITPNSYFQTVLALVLHRMTRQERLMLATVSNGRSLAQMDDIMGMFVKTLPLVFAVDGDAAGTTFATVAQSIHRQSIESMSRDFYPLTEIVERHGLHPEILYAFEGGIYDNIAASFSPDTDVIVPSLDTPKMPIEVMVYPDRQGVYKILLNFDTALYSQASMSALANALTCCAISAAKEGVLLSDIELTTDEQRDMLVELGRGKHIDLDTDKTYMDYFLQRVTICPDALAVADTTSSLSYSQLDRYSNLMAVRLLAAEVQPRDFVGVMTERTCDFPVCVFGIHKAGAAYLPLDPTYPTDRLCYMLEDSGTRILVTTHALLDAKRHEDGLDVGNVNVIYIDDIDWEGDAAKSDPVNRCTPDGYTYIIYTSGSTGRPKGAVLHQKGLLNYIFSTIEELELTSNDRISSHRSFSFDSHIEDMYPILQLGGSLHIMPEGIRRDLDAIYQFIVRHHVTGGGYPTAVAKLLVNTFDLPLRYISAIGERLTGVVASSCKVFNFYGPTECTDHISVHLLQQGRKYENIPIGHVVANNWCFIVDSDDRLLPRGAVGELCIAGIQVGVGYWQRPQLTAEKFVDCPFVARNIDGTPVRMYHTGDLCRWNANGELEYIGRTDDQVKLRGYRVELGEIEACATRFEGVSQAVAVIRPIKGTDMLCLYYTVKQGGSDLDANELRYALSCSLPEYMVPTAYMQLDTLPMTPNGKVDRRRLPAIEHSILNIDYVAPRNELERLIVGAFEQVLGQNRVGIHDDFVYLGGDSLKALRVIHALGKSSITVADVLNLRTPAAIASNAKSISVNLNKYSIESGCPLNNSQIFIFNDILKFNKYDSYLMPSLIPIDGKYTDEQIRNALDVMFTAHPVLTMHVAMRDGVPYMEKGNKPVVMKGSLNPLKIISLLTSGFDLYSSLSRHVIVRIPGRCYLLSVFHHLIFDVVSEKVFSRHFLRALEGESLDFVDNHFLKVSSFHQEVRSTEQYAEMEKYIRSMLGNLTDAYFYRNLGKHGRPGYHKRELGVSREQVNRFTERFGITKNILFTAAMAMTLSKLVGNNDVAFGFLDNGRDRFDNFEDIGLYITGMPLVTHVDYHDMKVFLENLSDVYYKLSQNNYFPFASLVQEFNLAPIILFQFFPDWIVENEKYNHLPKNETIINKVVSTQKDFMVEALVNVTEMKDSYTIRIMYSGYYSRKMMKALAKTYKETITEMLKI